MRQTLSNKEYSAVPSPTPAPPELLSGPARRELLAQIVRALLPTCALLTLTGVLNNLLGEMSAPRLALSVFGLISVIAIWRLLRRGRVYESAVALITSMLAICAVSALFVSGVLAPNYPGFFVIIALMTTVTTPRWVVVSLLMFILVGAVSLINPLGVQMTTPPPARYWIIYSLFGVLLAQVLLLTRAAFNRAAEQLATREALLSSILLSTCDPLIALNDRRALSHMNPSAARLDEEVRAQLGVGLLEAPLDHPDTHARAALLDHLDLSAPAPQTLRLQLQLGGQARCLSVTASPQLHEGRPIGTVLALKDVTAEQALAQAQKMSAVGALANGVAHDLNNMLSAVKSATELLSLELDGDHDDLLTMISDATARAARLTAQLQALSRRDAAPRAPVDLCELLRGLSAHHAAPAGVARAPITLEQCAPPGAVLGDEGLLHGALTHLALNALEATPPSGRVSLRARLEELSAEEISSFSPPVAPGRYICVEVEDDGEGMTPEVLARALDPFFTTRAPRHSGLGLSIVYRVAERHGGALALRSAPGEGTLVRLALPLLDPADASASASSSSALTPAPLPGALTPVGVAVPLEGKALVIDDEPLVRQGLLRMLSALGVRADGAESGDAGLALLRAAPRDYSVVILDMVMPEKSGREVFYELKEERPDLPIIVSSGFSPEGDIDELRARGLAAALHKPYELQDLRAALLAAAASGA